MYKTTSNAVNAFQSSAALFKSFVLLDYSIALKTFLNCDIYREGLNDRQHQAESWAVGAIECKSFDAEAKATCPELMKGVQPDSFVPSSSDFASKTFPGICPAHVVEHIAREFHRLCRIASRQRIGVLVSKIVGSVLVARDRECWSYYNEKQPTSLRTIMISYLVGSGYLTDVWYPMRDGHVHPKRAYRATDSLAAFAEQVSFSSMKVVVKAANEQMQGISVRVGQKSYEGVRHCFHPDKSWDHGNTIKSWLGPAPGLAPNHGVLIEGKPTARIEFENMKLNLAYSLEKMPLPSPEQCAAPGISYEEMEVAALACLDSKGYSGYRREWLRRRASGQTILENKHVLACVKTGRETLARFREIHHALRNYWLDDKSGKLLRKYSARIRHACIKCLTQCQVPFIWDGDGVYVGVEHIDAVEQIMRQKSMEYCGQALPIKPKHV